MSYVTLADLRGPGGHGGHGDHGGHGGGGGRRWRGGGGYPYWYGGGPWYDGYGPIVVLDPVDAESPEAEKRDREKAQEEAEKVKIKRIAAAVRAELAKKDDLGQFYMDVMGPGARDDEVGAEGSDNEVVDEAISARDALLWRQRQGLVGLSDATDSGPVAAIKSGLNFLGCPLWVGVALLVGGATGYAVSSYQNDQGKAKKPPQPKKA